MVREVHIEDGGAGVVVVLSNGEVAGGFLAGSDAEEGLDVGLSG